MRRGTGRHGSGGVTLNDVIMHVAQENLPSAASDRAAWALIMVSMGLELQPRQVDLLTESIDLQSGQEDGTALRLRHSKIRVE